MLPPANAIDSRPQGDHSYPWLKSDSIFQTFLGLVARNHFLNSSSSVLPFVFVPSFTKIRIIKRLILKTIGNRKGDCAWSCSRGQTQPEKICKSQRTNQCHSLRTLYWFVLCNLQIFSGCVCPLEQLHAQSPFLFPIVFSINLIPFFDICSVDLLAVFQPGCSGIYVTLLLYLGRCAVATVGVCGFGSWSLVFDCGMPRQISALPPTPSQTEVCSTITMGESITWESIHEKAYIQVRPSSFSQSNALCE